MILIKRRLIFQELLFSFLFSISLNNTYIPFVENNLLHWLLLEKKKKSLIFFNFFSTRSFDLSLPFNKETSSLAPPPPSLSPLSRKRLISIENQFQFGTTLFLFDKNFSVFSHLFNEISGVRLFSG